MTALMFKYQDCLFDWSGILRPVWGKKTTNWGTLGIREESLLFLREPSAKMGHSSAMKVNLWRGEKGSRIQESSVFHLEKAAFY